MLSFPIFKRYQDLVYLDNAATTQKPIEVLEAQREFYLNANANPYRGVYDLSAKATAGYEAARCEVLNFLKAKDGVIIFTRGTTEAINLVASSYGPQVLSEGDTIVTTIMEHHSNFLPWQRLAKQCKANLEVIKLTPEGRLDLEDFKRLLTFKPKIVALAHVSNVLGTVNDLETIIKLSHAVNAAVCVDGAQAVGHLEVNLSQLQPDFYAFSGHKMYAPLGIGALYIAKNKMLDMAPWQLGGGMVAKASLEGSAFLPLPQLLEAGTPNVEGAVSLAAAIKWLKEPEVSSLIKNEALLTAKMLSGLASMPEITVLGPTDAAKRISIASFNVKGIHPHDVATFLARQQIAVRAGHHCAMPLMDFYHINAAVRASLAVYNTENDIDKLIKALKQLIVWWQKH